MNVLNFYQIICKTVGKSFVHSATVSLRIPTDSSLISLTSHIVKYHSVPCNLCRLYSKKVKLSHYRSREALRQGFQLYTPTALSPGRYSSYSLFLEAESTPQDHYVTGRIKLMRNPSNTIGNRTRDLPTCSAVPHSTTPPSALAVGINKAVPLLAWSSPQGSRKLRFPVFMTTAQDGGKVVSLTDRPPLRPGNTPGTHFC
jgi:hypothetical protein